MARWTSTNRPDTLILFSLLLIASVSGGSIEPCPAVDTGCKCYSLRMMNPTVIVKCVRTLAEEFPALKPKVITFGASQTRTKALQVRSFVNATDLGMISIVDNPIAYIEDEAFRSLPNLVILELANIKFGHSSISALHGIRTMTKLTLSDNILKSFTSDSLVDVPLLDILELDGNFITQFRFSHDRLRMLNLSRNYLQDVQKDSFQNLRMLEILDLSKNLIVHLRNFASPSLHSLILAYNQIEVIDEATWQDVPGLTYIDMSNNQIRSLGNISGLPFLESLNVSNNLIKNLDGIHGLQTVVHLDLSKNRIKTVSEISDLPNLKSLNLAENGIEYFDSNALQNSPLLTCLSLEGNRLTAFGSLSNNPQLVSLYLQNNKIEHIEQSAFSSSASLEYIDVGSNKLSNLQAFKNMPSLSYLNVSENLIIELSGQNLQGCPRLSILDMSKNLFEELPTFPVIFWPFHLYMDFNPVRVFDWNKLRNLLSLRRLSLNRTLITYIPPNDAFMPTTQISIKNRNGSMVISDDAFTSLVSLSDLSVDSLADVSPLVFRATYNLKKLELRSGTISEVTREWQFTSLEFLDLSHNRINRIDIDSRAMSRLKYMIATNNLISNVSFVNYLSNIRSLDLRHNRIRHVPKDAFVLCPTLNTLDLSYNMIEEIIVGTFDTNQYLKNLRLSYNRLRQFSLAFDPSTTTSHEFKVVSKLHLDGNRINAIDYSTFQSGDFSLKVVNMSRNPLQLINETTFHSFYSLDTIDLSHTDLKSLPVGLLNGIAYDIDHVLLNNVTCLKDVDIISLTYPRTLIIYRLELKHNGLTRIPSFNSNIVFELDVSHNNLSEVSSRNIGSTEDLTFLDVSMNRIAELDKNFIQSVPLLKHLNVSGNKLKQIRPDLFDGLLNLKTIDLTNNELEGVELNIMEDLKTNVRINATGNPMTCNCSLGSFSTYLKRCLGLFGDEAPDGGVMCQYPPRLSGQYVADVTLDQFQCKPELDHSKSAVYGLVGDEIHLECPVRDTNGVTVTWQNVTEFRTDRHIRASGDGRLLIEEMTAEDSGTYRCNATNYEGSEVMTVHLWLNQFVNRTTIMTSNVMSRFRVTVDPLAGTERSTGTFESQSDDASLAQKKTRNSLPTSSSSDHSQNVSMELTVLCAILGAVAVVIA